MTNRITVLGSINLDTTYHVDRMPQPGETIAASNKTSAAGGKGANQAVAAARSGASTAFIGMVGGDDAGQFMRTALAENNVDISNVFIQKDIGTGSAAIILNQQGQNSIMVYGGANHEITPATINQPAVIDTIRNSDFLIAQFETPQAATLAAFKIAREHGVKTILNPAPAKEVSAELLAYTDLLVPNETESEALTGITITDAKSLAQTGAYFAHLGVHNLLITLGSKGVYLYQEKQATVLPAYKVQAIDTTGAGDTFIGSMTAQLKPDFSNLEEAVNYGQTASSLAVQGLGAMPSIPTAAQIAVVQAKNLTSTDA
ncbi:ribokinase [Ligilactobacillus saerimneri]